MQKSTNYHQNFSFSDETVFTEETVFMFWTSSVLIILNWQETLDSTDSLWLGIKLYMIQVVDFKCAEDIFTL